MKPRILTFIALFLGTSLSAEIVVDSIRQTTYDYACVDGNDNVLSKHQRQDKADSACTTRKLNDLAGDYSVIGGRWRIQITGANAQSYPGANDSLPIGEGEPPNDPPVWNNTPAPVFIEGVVGSYDLTADFSDPESDTITLVNEAGCTLPTGVTLDDANDELDGSGSTVEGTTTGCVFSAKDPTNTKVNSSAFSIIVLDTVWATHSPTNTVVKLMSGNGMDWATFLATLPTYQFLYITNLNTSGAGSFDQALTDCNDAQMTFIIAEVSGLIVYPQNSLTSVECDNLYVAFQYAPSPGLHTKGIAFAIIGSTRQLWAHYSCFGDNDLITQPTGHCLDINGNNAKPNQDIVVLNFGGSFAYDGAINIFHDTLESTITQSMSLYPLTVKFGQGYLIGNNANDTHEVTFSRNITTHSEYRCPRVVESSLLISNNVCHNDLEGWNTAVSRTDALGIDVNIMDNLYVYGNDSFLTVPPILYGNFIGDITVAVDVYRDGNRAFGFADSPSSLLVTDRSDGNVTEAGSPVGTVPTGYVSTTIASLIL